MDSGERGGMVLAGVSFGYALAYLALWLDGVETTLGWLEVAACLIGGVTCLVFSWNKEPNHGRR